MGLFSRKPRLPLVSVSFRDLASTQPADAAHAYVYTWSLPSPPSPGMRVIVPGSDGRPAPAVVAAVDVAPPKGLALKAVTRVVTPAEIQKAIDDAAADELAWLSLARRAAGLPVTGRSRTRVPAGYPEIAPADGAATAEQANRYGRMWWRAYKAAQSHSWPAAEISRVESIARRWYAVRDKGGN